MMLFLCLPILGFTAVSANALKLTVEVCCEDITSSEGNYTLTVNNIPNTATLNDLRDFVLSKYPYRWITPCIQSFMIKCNGATANARGDQLISTFANNNDTLIARCPFLYNVAD